ncbi:MAG: biotin synthase BioB [Deltaproteobacteria bacterium GWC2_42_11]|nr:MAG: biotin synthase BioB [Deltaproteobacteria bacterium GWC2_42_11]HBO84651.1 biotin synthase BioB [Deltaproteobacteria bacterium]
MHRDFILNLEKKVFTGQDISYEEGCRLINLSDDALFEIIASAERTRRHFKGIEINLCSIVNAKSGMCQEDCSFCSQSAFYNTDIQTYPMIEPKDIVNAAVNAAKNGAREFSIVTSGTAVGSDEDISILIDAIHGIKQKTILERCASLGITKKEVLLKLKEAGLQSYHHNLETARSFFPNICTTHDYEDDVNVIKTAKELGFYICCGGVFGLGETKEQRVELAVTLRELGVDSIPINFLNPRPGTPLENANHLTPIECLKIIALYRFMLPQKDIVICGGRPANLRDMQCLIFAAGANGMMIGNYLTTMGRQVEEDLKMIRDLGLKPRIN